MLASFEMNDIEKMNTVLKNTVKMLSRRVYFEDDKKYQLLNYGDGLKVISELTEDNIYIFKCKNDTKICVKILPQKISSINKITAISDVLKNYPEHHKIFVFKEYAKKIKQQLPKAEIFQEAELMADVLDFEYQPIFEQLSVKEKMECMTKYNIEDNSQFPKIKISDPVAKYLRLRIGDVLRVLIPSELSGQRVEYAIITK